MWVLGLCIMINIGNGASELLIIRYNLHSKRYLSFWKSLIFLFPYLVIFWFVLFFLFLDELASIMAKPSKLSQP
jgi:hypothetical protein